MDAVQKDKEDTLLRQKKVKVRWQLQLATNVLKGFFFLMEANGVVISILVGGICILVCIRLTNRCRVVGRMNIALTGAEGSARDSSLVGISALKLLRIQPFFKIFLQFWALLFSRI